MTRLGRALALLAALVACGAAATPARAAETPSLQATPNQTGWSGVGVAISNLATGVTAKLWASHRAAGQATLGGGPGGNNLRLNVDLTLSPFQWRSGDGQYLLAFYAGAGGIVGHAFATGTQPSSTEVGFRVPVGMSILVSGNPVELFVEVAPELVARNASALGRYTFYSDGAIGVRYYL